MKETLIVVDVQRDFYHPSGSLYVKGGEQVVENIAKYIAEHAKDLDKVIFTLDWHPFDIKAYREPQIAWPVHCTQNSEGAGVANDLIRTCIRENVKMEFFYKGMEAPHTEYGAFENIGTWCEGDGNLVVVTNNRANNCTTFIKTRNVVVAGIAGDYCVMNTIKNLKKYDGPVEMDIFTFMDGICSIDETNATIKQYCIENHISAVGI